eukprot:135472_1
MYVGQQRHRNKSDHRCLTNSIESNYPQSQDNHSKPKRNPSYNWLLYLTLSVLGIIVLYSIATKLEQHDDYMSTEYKQTAHHDYQNTSGFSKLNRSLFCPLITESDKNTYSAALNYIYHLQFTRQSEKYLIFVPSKVGCGLFCEIGQTSIIFGMALATKRTFLYLNDTSANGNYKYLPKLNGKTLPICQNRTGRNCIFEAISSFTDKETQWLLQNTAQNETYILDDDCDKLYDDGIETIQQLEQKTSKYKIIFIHDDHCKLLRWRHRQLTRDMTQNWNISYYQFTALTFSYLLRIHENIRDLIYKEVHSSLFDRYNWSSSETSISLPIRASDKCNHEMLCVRLSDLDPILQTLKSNYKSIIITSESKEVIQQTKSIYKDLNHIYNDFDALQGTGNPAQMNMQKDKHSFNVLMSMLSTLKLQMHSTMYIIERESNWLHGIWLMSANIDCQLNPIHSNIKKQCVSIMDRNVDWNTNHCYRPQLAFRRWSAEPTIWDHLVKWMWQWQ